MKILVFGNPAVREDALPLRLLPQLRKAFPEIEFREFDAVEDLEREGGELVILDTVQGIKKVKVFDGVESFEESPRYSMHDFDLPVYLKLLKKVGIVRSATIIGVPMAGEEAEVLADAEAVIRKMVRDG